MLIETMTLGFQTTPKDVTRTVRFLCASWAPKKTKSYTIIDLRNTDYYGNPRNHKTGYGKIRVKYFSSKKEGKVKLC